MLRDEILNKQDVKTVHIFSDSQSTVGLLTLGWKPSHYKQTVKETSDLIQELQNKNIGIKISWTPVHADIPGNETADRLAKEASLEAKSLDSEVSITTHSDIKRCVNFLEVCKTKWQRQ